MHTVTPKTHRLPDNKPKSWLEALEPADVAKQLAFYESTAKHRNMEQLFEDLMPLLIA
jgi:hypothetical protein